MKLCSFSLLLFLAACAPTYSEDLAQQLQGKSTEEKRVILARECGRELRRGYVHAQANKAEHYAHMRYICETITGHDLYKKGTE